MQSSHIRAQLSMEEFIRGLPKAELHVHIEGTLEPELAFDLAKKYSIILPYASAEQLREAYQFTDLQSFLNIYYSLAQVLRNQDDFHALAAAYLRKVHAQGVVHVEIFFDPQTHTAGLRRALLEAEREFGITSRLILCFLRHLSADDATRTLEDAFPHKEGFAAVGLDSSETGHPPSKFAAVFGRARSEGLLAVAHAGEEGPPAYIYEALDILHVQRIVNSDDPAYFGGYILENYVAIQRALGLSHTELAALARNSIEASFLEQPDKHRWTAAIDAYVRGSNVNLVSCT